MSNSEASIATNGQNLKDFWNPPGGILVWLFVLAELLFFGIGFFMLARLRHANAAMFTEGQSHLNIKIGFVLTFTLLLSGWQLAEFVHNYFKGEIRSAKNHFHIGFACGLIFLICKGLDFYHKIHEGFVLGSNDFWDFYWLFTGFHFLHVFLGVIILAIVKYKQSRHSLADADFAIRGSANFWHMCDIIWLFMFPLFYLGKLS